MQVNLDSASGIPPLEVLSDGEVKHVDVFEVLDKLGRSSGTQNIATRVAAAFDIPVDSYKAAILMRALAAHLEAHEDILKKDFGPEVFSALTSTTADL